MVWDVIYHPEVTEDLDQLGAACQSRQIAICWLVSVKRAFSCANSAALGGW